MRVSEGAEAEREKMPGTHEQSSGSDILPLKRESRIKMEARGAEKDSDASGG
jgi:hypothetical protein